MENPKNNKELKSLNPIHFCENMLTLLMTFALMSINANVSINTQIGSQANVTAMVWWNPFTWYRHHPSNSTTTTTTIPYNSTHSNGMWASISTWIRLHL
jgi:hypothetical protein